MTVESNYAIATLRDWLKSLAPFLQPARNKTKACRILYAGFSRALGKLQVISR